MSKGNLNLIWEWERSAFPFYLWLFLTQWRYCKFSPPVYAYMIYKNKVANCYLDVKTLNKAAQTILDKIQNNPDFFKKWKKFVMKTGKEVHKFCDRIEKLNLEEINDKKLFKIYQESIKTYLNHTDGVAVIRNSNRLLQEKLTQIYKNPEIVSLLLSTDKKSIMIKEHEDLLKIIEVSKKKKYKTKEIKNLLKKHAKKYFYLPCGFSDEKPFSTTDFEKKFKEILRSKENLKDFVKKLKQNVKQRKEIISKLKPTPKLKRLIEFGSTCTYFKDFIRGNLNRLHYQNRRIFKEIGKRTKNNWEDIACLIPNELMIVLKNKKKIERRDLAVLFSDKQGIHLLLKNKAKKKLKEIERKVELKAPKEIKGVVANPGKVKGEVLLVHEIENATGKKDFILVSSMTTPDLVPAVKKAKAIVTDEGGLTCHAAIVSREIGIPCIVGTKIATKVLKDGDLVEVDANKGIVRILKTI